MYTFKGMIENLKYVLWRSTLHLLFLRAIGFALVVGTIATFTSSPSFRSPFDMLLLWLLTVCVGTIGGTFIYPWIGFVAWWILILFVGERGLRSWAQKSETFMVLIAAPIVFIAGIAYLGCTLNAMVGDLFVLILKRLKPQWVPVAKYGFFNPFPVVFVLDPERIEQLELMADKK
ncbi:MAG: hypothetical protein J7456_07390 [Chloroflexus sp.]|nr:hypothetical protein [Chloroflexus sp.]